MSEGLPEKKNLLMNSKETSVQEKEETKEELTTHQMEEGKSNPKRKTEDNEDQKPEARKVRRVADDDKLSGNEEEESDGEQSYMDDKCQRIFASAMEINEKTGEKDINKSLAWNLALQAQQNVMDLEAMIAEQQRVMEAYEHLRQQKPDSF